MAEHEVPGSCRQSAVWPAASGSATRTPQFYALAIAFEHARGTCTLLPRMGYAEGVDAGQPLALRF